MKRVTKNIRMKRYSRLSRLAFLHLRKRVYKRQGQTSCPIGIFLFLPAGVFSARAALIIVVRIHLHCALLFSIRDAFFLLNPFLIIIIGSLSSVIYSEDGHLKKVEFVKFEMEDRDLYDFLLKWLHRQH